MTVIENIGEDQCSFKEDLLGTKAAPVHLDGIAGDIG